MTCTAGERRTHERQANSDLCRQSKGGTAKTTTAENLGIGLAREGKKVLLVDTDLQGSLSISLGYPRPDDLETTLFDLLNKTINEESIQPGEGILHQQEGVDLIPANISLALEITLHFGKGTAEPFTSKDGKEMMRIVIPNQDRSDHTPWASFVLPAKAVHENQYGKGLWAKVPAR